MDDLGTKLGYAEYCAIPEDGKRHEIIDGAHFVNPAPTPRHQRCSTRLAAQLVRTIDETGLGEVLSAPLDVQLSQHNVVQPDIVVVLAGNKHSITESRIVGTPDFVVEILAPSTAQHDRTRKFALYEKSGIREYWIVDAAERSVVQYALIHGRYEHIATSSEKLRLLVLPDIEIDLTRIWG